MDKILGFISKIDVIKLGIAFTVMICLNWIVYALVNHEIPEGNRDVLVHSLGLIEGVVVTIAAYYWGSSSGSKEKTEHMANMNKPTVSGHDIYEAMERVKKNPDV